MSGERVPVSELVDLARVRADGRPPTPREIRAALPRGWTLDEDGEHARRDLRLFFREGWILLLGLVLFGTLGGAFLIDAMPRGWAGAGRLVVLVGIVVLIGGVVGPIITRALYRRG
ncbi:MAG: hypothetical protein AAF682_17820 [Planctomycetota bacterium]